MRKEHISYSGTLVRQTRNLRGLSCAALTIIATGFRVGDYVLEWLAIAFLM